MCKNIVKKGFSLAELSIVLIIIGLLVAGVSAGSKMIKSAELNRMVTEITEINTAYTTFVQTYDALPGDFDNAEAFWGTDGLINGDGDGKVESTTGTLLTAGDGDESSNVFHHLSLSEILPGNYNVRIDAGTYAYASSTNAKAIIVNEKDSAGASHTGFISTLSGKNVLLFGKTLSAITRILKEPGVYNAFLVPKDAYRMDQKLDDGLPDTGKISFRDETTPAGDVTPVLCKNATPTPDTYLLTATVKGCNLVYELDSL